MNLDLFDSNELPTSADELLAPGAAVLRGFATGAAAELLEGIRLVTASAPFRHLVTPGGFTMSVAMTNCGEAGWVSDRTGYRYDRIDRRAASVGRRCRCLSLRWRKLPPPGLASRRSSRMCASSIATAPGTRLSLHQDRDEKGYVDPIVSVSLGLPAVFQWGGEKRADQPRRVR